MIINKCTKKFILNYYFENLVTIRKRVKENVK